jgi:hypothetical protein
MEPGVAFKLQAFLKAVGEGKSLAKYRKATPFSPKATPVTASFTFRAAIAKSP